MPHACLRALRGLAAAALAAPLLAIPAAGHAATADPAPAASPVSPSAATATTGHATQVLLITGDQLLVPPGSPNTAVIPASSKDAPFVFLSDFGCSSLKIPADALPYLGRGLDPALFQLAGLERAERGGRLPVRLSYLGARPTLPGVTLTHTSQGAAEGYLTAASARAFGAALRRQFTADHRTGSYGTRGLFAHGLSIGLTGEPAPPAQPDFPMRTLTVTGSNLAGKPDTGNAVLVFNLDNCNKLDPVASVNTFFHGAAKFSLPAGHYWAAAMFFGQFPDRLVILPQLTVEHSTKVHVSARAASSTLTVKTPRPARLSTSSFTLLRSSHGFTEGISWVNAQGPRALRVSLVRHRPSIGRLQAYTQAAMFSGPVRGTPYIYLLDFPAPAGTIPPLHYTAHTAGLAAVHEHYYKDTKVSDIIPPDLGLWATVGGSRAEIATGLASGFFFATRMPGSQIQYLSARPALWRTFFSPFAFFDSQDGPLRLYHAGRVQGSWSRYPLHPTPNASLPGAGLFPARPSATRTGNTLSLDIIPFGDNQPGDIGTGYFSCLDFRFSCKGTFALYQNGVEIAKGNAANRGSAALAFHAKLSPKPSLIKFVMTADRSGHKAYLLSAASKDVWTWRSRPEPKATVPAPWHCPKLGSSPAPARTDHHCAVQDMSTLRYQVAGLSLRGVTKPGRQQIAITASPIQLAPATSLTHASVQVSFDGGKTWHVATVSKLAAGKFRAVFTAPASTKVTLRTHVAGAAGVSVTETINDAFAVAGH